MFEPMTEALRKRLTLMLRWHCKYTTFLAYDNKVTKEKKSDIFRHR